MKLEPNELHNHLMQRDMTEAHREIIKEIVRKQKAAHRSEKAQRTKVRAEWAPLLEGLRMERESLRSMRNYKSGHRDPKVITAIEGYGMVLDRLKAEFNMHKRECRTPAVLARERGLPNGGIHWTDWVKDKFKERVSALFAEIQPKPRAKAKTPFLRTTTAESNDRLRTRLHIRTLNEHGIAVQNNQLNPSERSKARVDKLAEALRRIDRLSPTDPVPRTWSGLFVEE
jgi:hypothetical protein